MTVAISPDGKAVVSGSEDNTIKVWQIERLARQFPISAIADSFSS